MNEITTQIEVINFQGYSSNSGSPNLALSGYTLPITPFTFKAAFSLATIPGVGGYDFVGTQDYDYLASEDVIPALIITEAINTQYVSDKRVVWEFGDGSFSTDLTGVHYYTKPGVYKINTYFYDLTGGVYKNTITPSVTCYNVVEDTFRVSISSEYLTSNLYVLTAGRIKNPFCVHSQSSWQNPGSGENYNATYGLRLLSGTASYFDQKLNTNKYGHLYPHSSFYELDEDGNFVEILETVVERTPLYCALSSSTPPVLYFTSKDTLSSVFCGVSGSNMVYVKDDISGIRQISVFAKSFDYNNTLPIIVGCTFQQDAIQELAISSNGITGEGSENSVFDIDTVKYVGQKINFVVTIKDNDYFTIKNNVNLNYNPNGLYPNLYLVTLDKDGNAHNSFGSFYSNFTYLSSITGGFFRGTFIPTTTAENIRIAAVTNIGISVGSFITLDDSDEYITLDDSASFFTLDDTITVATTLSSLSAISNSFNVYPSGGNNRIAKVNEDFDFSGTLNELRYQEFLLDKTVLFDDFLGTAFGGASADPMAPGKLAYEKIANFTQNTGDVYRSNLQAFLSMNSMLGGQLDVYDATAFSSPSKLKRLIDLISINHSRLWGSRNQYNENFNSVLGADSDVYGLNLGDKLDFFTTVLTSGYDNYIVALERFSNKYTKCSTFISLISTQAINASLSTYALSSYNNTWGWGLMLLPGLTGDQIPKYYDFFEYIPTPENSHYNNVINFEDPYTTISYYNSSYNDWIKRGGIVDEMIDYILYTGTGVLSS